MKPKNVKKFANLKFRPQLFDIEKLQANISNNFEYFNSQSSSASTELLKCLQKLSLTLEKSSQIYSEVESAAQMSDYDENSIGNGYWSFLHNFVSAEKQINKICKQMTKCRDKIFFNRKHYCK
jgi:Na+-transporting NADH:ubiquinone oxidoreductase subunit NqrC